MQFDLVAIAAKFHKGQYAIHPHADAAMQDDNVTIEFLEEAIGRDSPRIIEEYQYSCLILGWGLLTEPIHAVVAFGTLNQEYDTPLLITVYRPDRSPQRWSDNYAKRV